MFQQIGKALLPPVVISKSLPAPTEVETPAPIDSSVQKPESVAETNIAPPKVEAAPQINSEAPQKVEAAPQVNSVPKAQVQEESVPVLSTSLSPYPNVR